MSAIAPSSPAGNLAVPIANRFGRFSDDGREYIITDVRTPRPWANVIANPRMGLAVSQTGSGFTWIDNSQLAVITRWEQDLARDSSGKFVYVRDGDSGEIWSLSPAPTWTPGVAYECRHGLGYTTFVSERDGVRATWTLFVDASRPLEMWSIRLENRSARPRRLELIGYLEWNCGLLPSPRREFHKLFLETEFDAARGAVLARNHMWDVPSEPHGHWNTAFPYVAAFAATLRPDAAEGDKAAFFGQYGDPRDPAALHRDTWAARFGRHEDPIAALRSPVTLAAGQTQDVGYVLAVGQDRAEATGLLDAALVPSRIEAALRRARQGWVDRLEQHRVETPDASIDHLANDWLRYQAISGRLWARCGYYQQSGALGFRDQLQDSQVWLTIDPAQCRAQISLHAAHQFADGSVYHWWHPLTEQGHRTRMTDDLLWLALVTANYVRETGDLSILADPAPFVDDPRPEPLVEHVYRALRRVFERTSPRGLPYIGAGDWNDGLSACGRRERGESIWLGHFVVGLLADWAVIFDRLAGRDDGRAARNGAAPWPNPPGAAAIADDFRARRRRLIDAINTHGWDGRWYLRATLDDGSPLGSAASRVGRIFLNAQTWAILSDVAPPERARQCMDAIRELLVSKAGPLLLAPAFDEPVPEIGYITRYAPGLRENGGVYTHAATWAIAAACKVRDRDLVGTLLDAINPAIKNPDDYWAEPYVLPGNVDGPESPYHGRAGWTWYTGSAAWLHRVVCEWVLGVRADWDSLRIAPCLPPGWSRARMTRPWRGCTVRLELQRAASLPPGAVRLSVNGQRIEGDRLAAPERPGEAIDVHVRFN